MPDKGNDLYLHPLWNTIYEIQENESKLPQNTQSAPHNF